METNFNFKSQVCTNREQSERLLALGLKKETADMGIIEGIEIDVIEVNWEEHSRHNSTPNFVSLPAWSLHRLIEMIDDEFVIHLNNFTISGHVFGVYNNLYDNIVECITYLISAGYFNKEYLV